MNLWNRHARQVEVVAPLEMCPPDPIDLPYEAPVAFNAVPAFHFKNPGQLIRTLLTLPVVFWKVFSVMRRATHIHLRCPGNMGLIGCFLQILFPSKTKTAKYAGNWDPKATQPFSYRLQRWILANRFLTRNMTVLVYGDFQDSSPNIKPFFTATYSESEKEPVSARELSGEIRFLFVGTLYEGKRPEYALRLVSGLIAKGVKARLDFFGNGYQLEALKQETVLLGLQEAIVFHGNQPEPKVREAYKTSHFLILASKSEGWPKVVAEAMFWGCVPLATPVSCVKYMLGNGSRGVLLDLDVSGDESRVLSLLDDQPGYLDMVTEGISWSRQFTLDLFDSEIARLMQE